MRLAAGKKAKRDTGSHRSREVQMGSDSPREAQIDSGRPTAHKSTERPREAERRNNKPRSQQVVSDCSSSQKKNACNGAVTGMVAPIAKSGAQAL